MNALVKDALTQPAIEVPSPRPTVEVEIVSNSNPARWVRAMADAEHDAEPRRPYEDVARERRVYERGGFGGAFNPPSGALEP